MLQHFAPIRTFVFDIDGVLTDGNILLMGDGHLVRSMNMKDVYALQVAVKKGYNVWAITSGKSDAVRARLNKIGIHEVHIGIENKKEVLREIAVARKSSYDTMLYMGDDISDYAAMNACNLPCCPADAVDEIKQIARYISPLKGGKGCVRDVIEKVLKLNNHWVIPS